MQALLEQDELLELALHAGCVTGMPVQLADDLGDVLGVDLLLEHPHVVLQHGQAVLLAPRARFSSDGSVAVAELGGALQVAVALARARRRCRASPRPPA